MGRRGRQRPHTASTPRPKRRLRMGNEKPGSVLKGPPITVTCECGERHDLFYGERWTCPSCERVYDSRQIPADEYARVRQMQLRYRALPMALGLLVLALAILFTFTGNTFGVFFLMPLAMIGWFVLIAPAHRKRYRAAVGDLPRWELRADR